MEQTLGLSDYPSDGCGESKSDVKVIRSSFLPDPPEPGTFTAISVKYIQRLIIVFVSILFHCSKESNPIRNVCYKWTDQLSGYLGGGISGGVNLWQGF